MPDHMKSPKNIVFVLVHQVDNAAIGTTVNQKPKETMLGEKRNVNTAYKTHRTLKKKKNNPRNANVFSNKVVILLSSFGFK